MTTKPDIWMAWYPGDYLRDTQHLTCLHHGAYRQMIDAVFCAGGRLSVTDEEVMRIISISEAEWTMIRDRIRAFFTIKGNTWSHKRVTEEIRKAKERKRLQTKRTEAARASLQKRREHSNNVCNSDCNNLLIPSPSPSQYKGEGNGSLSSAELITREKELERVEAEIKKMRERNGDSKWKQDDRNRLVELKNRKEELLGILGMTV